MPWRISGILDVVLMFENLLRAWLICKIWVGYRKTSGKMRNPTIFIAISYFAVEAMWSLGTMNWGTAVRHHIPGFGLLVLAAFIYSKPRRKKTSPPIPTNVPVTP